MRTTLVIILLFIPHHLPSSAFLFLRLLLVLSSAFLSFVLARLGSVSFNVIDRASRQRTSLDFGWRDFDSVSRMQSEIDCASRQRTSLAIHCEFILFIFTLISL